MQWLSLIVALLQAISALTSYLKEKKLIEAATADLLKKQLDGASEIIAKAKAARKAAADKSAASGGVLDESDPNLRD